MVANDLVRNGRAVPGHAEHVLLGVVHGLLNCERNLVRLTVPHANCVHLVAHDHQGREREAATALDDLGHTVHLNDALLELDPVRADLFASALCHLLPRP